MAFDKKSLKRDANDDHVPQRYNPVTDDFEVETVMEFFGLSTDTKPATNLKVGSTFFEIDTTNAFMWDGSGWRAI